MRKNAKEWLKQAKYDIETAEYLLKGERNSYAVFLCHLSIEKALKGVYQKRVGRIAPKTHNFIYMLRKSEIEPPQEYRKFLAKLNGASVITRYPENLEKVKKFYPLTVVKEIVHKSKQTLEWIESMY
ncbi:MAG: HEPN domain-containing protein [Nitrospinae bacterium]|nr:HEPN domain-containing protein [Nitrospinota bacterium]